MNNIICGVLSNISTISVETATGLEIALGQVGGLDPNLDASAQRNLLIQVIAPRLDRHPVPCAEAYEKLHAPLRGYVKTFSTHVAPAICNLFLFE